MIKLKDLKENSLTINENHIVMIEPFDVETRQSGGVTTFVHCSKITLTTGHVVVASAAPDSISLGSGVAEKS
jgi:CTP-dependent riboflavin kinase